jgi:hypothetical protein
MPELPTCECVAALPPMQRWGAIAAAAQTLAGTEVTSFICARTMNEVLDDIYCALYSLVT